MVHESMNERWRVCLITRMTLLEIRSGLHGRKKSSSRCPKDEYSLGDSQLEDLVWKIPVRHRVHKVLWLHALK